MNGSGFDSHELRGRAIERLRERHGSVAAMPSGEVEKLVHELEVYQVELEVQNEELRRAELARVSALERYRDLYDRAPVGYLTLDAEGRILQANQAAAQLFFQDRENLEGRYLQEFVLPQDRDRLWLLLRAAGAGWPKFAEWQIPRPEGEPRWVHIDTTVLVDADAKTTGVRLTLTDITVRVLTEDALRQSEERLRLATASADAGMWSVRIADQHWELDAQALRLFGFPDESPRTIEEIRERLHPDDRARLAGLGTTSAAGTLETECRVTGPGIGQTRWLMLRGRTEANLETRPARNVGVVMDITARKQLEERLAHAQKMEAIGLLARGIAHDFNNLLVGMIGNASLLQETAPEGSPTQPLLARIISAGEHAAALTQQLLAYAGKGTFDLAPVDLSRLARENVELIRSTIPNKVELRLDLAETLPSVRADASQLEQVFMNLVLNAAEAIASERGTIDVVTGLREIREPTVVGVTRTDVGPGRYVTLEVIDTGCGMDAETIAKIFDPFFTTKFIGRGLGLAAVAGIVHAHGGAIEVESEPGKGSRFTVLLPAAGARALPAEKDAGAAAAARAIGTVLVVDDEEVVREMAASVLARHGYEVLLAENGTIAIERFREAADRTGLVFLDLGMPGMGGEDVLPRLLEIKAGVKVLVSSGYPETEVARVFRNAHYAGFIQKPFTARQLAEKIRQVMG